MKYLTLTNFLQYVAKNKGRVKIEDWGGIRMEKWRAVAFTGAVFLGFGIFMTLCLLSIGKAASGSMSSQEKLGKQVWQKHGCVECHTIFGHGGYLAEDLTAITKEVPANRLKEFLSDPPVMRPAKRRKHPGHC